MAIKKQTQAAPEPTPPATSKKDMVIQLLRREGGATLVDVTNATAWLPHTARAMLTGLRKKGFSIAKREGGRYKPLFDHQRAGRVKKADRITEEVRALAALDLHGLRDAWRRHGYGEPPKMRSQELLARLLAWKIQADAFGGLDATTIRLLKSDRVPAAKLLLQPGTRLAREWQGRRYEVDVLEQGFQLEGATYRSLSHVARAITGTRWNGLRFFGLREASAK